MGPLRPCWSTPRSRRLALPCLPRRTRPQPFRPLLAGKHVYLEKPLALTLEDADRILEAARSGRTSLPHGVPHALAPPHSRGPGAWSRRANSGRIESIRTLWFSPRDDEGLPPVAPSPGVRRGRPDGTGRPLFRPVALPHLGRSRAGPRPCPARHPRRRGYGHYRAAVWRDTGIRSRLREDRPRDRGRGLRESRAAQGRLPAVRRSGVLSVGLRARAARGPDASRHSVPARASERPGRDEKRR